MSSNVESSPLQVDIFLTILAAVALFVFWIFATYILVHFQHPDDVTGNRIPKLIIILGLTLVNVNVFLLPMDVASRQSRYGGLPMQYLWYCTYALMGALGLFLIPFTIFYYEAEDPLKPRKSLTWPAFWKLALIFLFFAAAAVVGYIFLGFADVETLVISSVLRPGNFPPEVADCASLNTCSSTIVSSKTWTLSFIIFLIVILTFAGFLVFSVFGGIGLIAIPHDAIYNFFSRPRPIDDNEYKANNVRLGERSEKLIKMGLAFTNPRSPDYNKREKIIKWKKDCYVLDEDFTRNKVAYKLKGGPEILAWITLFGGIFCALMSIMWIIQIIAWTNISIIGYNIGYPLLNYMLIAMDGVWEFFGVFFFALFAMYLEFCVIVGNFKWGLRIPWLIELHPMRHSNTLISSFLVNTELLLVASLAVTQFCARTFSVYVRVTSGNSIFVVAVGSLRGLRWAWFAFGWILLGFAFITLLYFMFRPSDKGKDYRAILSEVDY